ncbi:suppressor of variegation 2-10 isoform i [Anaeramoeba flamelloides]|uniref:Suppressor of variegation 2-10 isoform i n=1 Tax=Anaeramoeba flamelloides TaxID=1746091 RepID=A0AAV7YNC4_9EUKA|nr:suppressor of variegation 2-10 isoform i [Anaeramoeba flamelloides]
MDQNQQNNDALLVLNAISKFLLTPNFEQISQTSQLLPSYLHNSWDAARSTQFRLSLFYYTQSKIPPSIILEILNGRPLQSPVPIGSPVVGPIVLTPTQNIVHVKNLPTNSFVPPFIRWTRTKQLQNGKYPKTGMFWKCFNLDSLEYSFGRVPGLCIQIGNSRQKIIFNTKNGLGECDLSIFQQYFLAFPMIDITVSCSDNTNSWVVVLQELQFSSYNENESNKPENKDQNQNQSKSKNNNNNNININNTKNTNDINNQNLLFQNNQSEQLVQPQNPFVLHNNINMNNSMHAHNMNTNNINHIDYNQVELQSQPKPINQTFQQIVGLNNYLWGTMDNQNNFNPFFQNNTNNNFNNLQTFNNSTNNIENNFNNRKNSNNNDINTNNNNNILSPPHYFNLDFEKGIENEKDLCSNDGNNNNNNSSSSSSNNTINTNNTSNTSINENNSKNVNNYNCFNYNNKSNNGKNTILQNQQPNITKKKTLSQGELIVNNNYIPENECWQIHKSKVFGEGSGLVIDQVSISLKCPLGMNRIKIPARAKQCSHIQCFDLQTFLDFTKVSNETSCPSCDRKFAIKDLIIDGFVDQILKKEKGYDQEMIIYPNGEWKRLKSVKKNYQIGYDVDEDVPIRLEIDSQSKEILSIEKIVASGQNGINKNLVEDSEDSDDFNNEKEIDMNFDNISPKNEPTKHNSRISLSNQAKGLLTKFPNRQAGYPMYKPTNEINLPNNFDTDFFSNTNVQTKSRKRKYQKKLPFLSAKNIFKRKPKKQIFVNYKGKRYKIRNLLKQLNNLN